MQQSSDMRQIEMGESAESVSEIDLLEQTLEVGAGTIRGHYERFRTESPDKPFDDFMVYLHENDIIDEETYVRVATTTSVDAISRDDQTLPSRRERYNVLARIDQGAMGEIRVARDRNLGRQVALKLLKSEVAGTNVSRRFIQEAQVTAQLDHPNIVPIYSIESEGQSVSFAMKLINGKTMARYIEEVEECYAQGKKPRGELSLRRRMEVIVSVCDALSYAHSKGVVHRDLKPANIMIGRFREVYVMDWGIARILGTAEDELVLTAPGGEDDKESESHEDYVAHTKVGEIIGTPRYMSPEQGLGDPLDHRSDIYTLGLLMYELATLTRARVGRDREEIGQEIVTGQLRPFKHKYGKTISPRLQAIIRKAAAPRREDRYATMEDLADDIRRWLEGESVKAAPDNLFQKAARWLVRHHQLALAMFLTFALLAASVVIFTLYERFQQSEANRLREERLSAFQTAVAKESNKINSQFLRFEEMVKTLANFSQFLLQANQASDLRVVSSSAFDAGGVPPVDATESEVYGRLISVNQPVYKLAPGVELDEVKHTLTALSPLIHQFRHIFRTSRDVDVASPDTAEAYQTLVLDKGVPAKWAYIGTESGIMFSYPGKGGYPADYDPRKRPWYAMGKRATSATWGQPYIDVQDKGIVLPCVSSVYDNEGQLLGVVGLEISFRYLVRDLMNTGQRASLEGFLLDDAGRVIVRTSQDLDAFKDSDTFDTLDLTEYPRKPVVQRIKRKESGQVQVEGPDGPIIVGFYRIPTLGWYYVEEAELAALMR